MKRFVAAALVACGLAVTAHAQVDRATLTGVVKDGSGAVVPGSAVTVTHVDTNVATRTQTTASGAYQVLNLAPGRYRVEAEAPGFRTAAEAVILEIGQRARLDFALAVGSLAESVRSSATRTSCPPAATRPSMTWYVAASSPRTSRTWPA